MKYLKVVELRSGRFVVHEEGDDGEIKTSEGQGEEGGAAGQPRGGSRGGTDPSRGGEPDRDKPIIDIDDGLGPRFREGRRLGPEFPDWVALVEHVKTGETVGEVTVYVRGRTPADVERVELLRALPPGVAVTALMRDGGG